MDVIVYTAPGCQGCIATKRSFDAVGLNYEVIDISGDKAAGDRLRDDGHRSLPVIEVYGDVAWSGFHPAMITKLIGQMTAA